MDETPADEEEAPDRHLEHVVDGAGCTEIWEYLSARRDTEERSG